MALESLAEAHLIALRPFGREVWMAHPFSGIETEFPVTMRGVTYHGNCAWDVIAIAVIVGGESVINFRCHCTGETEEVRVTDRDIIGNGVIHHVVPARRFWDDVGFT